LLIRPPLIPAGKAGGDAYAYGDASGAGGMTELQKHAAFFDANNDGIVSFSETYDGDPFPPYSVTTFSSFFSMKIQFLLLFKRILQLIFQVCLAYKCPPSTAAFRSFGFGIAASTLSATFINAGLCPMTRPVNSLNRKTNSCVFIVYLSEFCIGG
jgi:hypothetical protein